MLNEKQLLKVLKKYKVEQDKQKKTEETIKSIGAQIKGELALRSTNNLKVGGYSVVLANVERPVLQGKELQAQYPAIYKAFTTYTFYDRLTVTD